MSWPIGPFTMKIHDDDLVSRAFWDHQQYDHDHRHQLSFLALGCKSLRPLAPKPPVAYKESPFDLKCFIHPKTTPRNLLLQQKDEIGLQVEISSQQPGGTRWNPTHEQIDILEMLYKRGMRTPSAEQIEQITSQLEKYSKIEGKNVFYWFQNHKARERQRYKRTLLALSSSSLAAQHHHTSFTFSLDIEGDAKIEGCRTMFKRKSRSWTMIDQNLNRRSTIIGERRKSEGEDDYKTLELFPLHPEGR